VLAAPIRRRTHALVGALGIAGFLASGLWMHYGHGHLAGYDAATRLAFRSIHIDILMASLVNVASAAAQSDLDARWRAAMAGAGTILIALAPFLLGAAFVREPFSGLERPLTRAGLIACAVGVVLEWVARLGHARSRKRAESSS
jgi:hypothetical protein